MILDLSYINKYFDTLNVDFDNNNYQLLIRIMYDSGYSILYRHKDKKTFRYGIQQSSCGPKYFCFADYQFAVYSTYDMGI